MGYKPRTIISTNRKTVDPSINLSRRNCRPSQRCRIRCYGRFGHIAMSNAVRKALWVSDYLLGDDISQLVTECREYPSIRLNGSGDALPGHVKNFIQLAESCPDTQFWGFSRKPEICLAANGQVQNLYFTLSIDPTTSEEVWSDYPGELAFGPRMKDDVVPEDTRIKVVFPYHFGGRIIKGIPVHPKDCPAVRYHSTHCNVCKQCFPPAARLAVEG